MSADSVSSQQSLYSRMASGLSFDVHPSPSPQRELGCGSFGDGEASDDEAVVPSSESADMWVQRLRVELATAKSAKNEALRKAREMERSLMLSEKAAGEARAEARKKELEAKALSHRLQAVESTLRSEREAIRPDKEALVVLADQAFEEAKLAKLEKETYARKLEKASREIDELKAKLRVYQAPVVKRSTFKGLRKTLTMAPRERPTRPIFRQALSMPSPETEQPDVEPPPQPPKPPQEQISSSSSIPDETQRQDTTTEPSQTPPEQQKAKLVISTATLSTLSTQEETQPPRLQEQPYEILDTSDVSEPCCY